MSDSLLAVGGVGLVSSRVDGQFHGKMFLSLSFKSCFSHSLYIFLSHSLSYFPNLVTSQVLLKLFDPSRHPWLATPLLTSSSAPFQCQNLTIKQVLTFFADTAKFESESSCKPSSLQSCFPVSPSPPCGSQGVLKKSCLFISCISVNHLK